MHTADGLAEILVTQIVTEVEVCPAPERPLVGLLWWLVVSRVSTVIDNDD